MSQILPQQKLLLELLIMSGDIGMSDSGEHEILDRTLQECVDANWVTLSSFGAGFNKASITDEGRKVASAT
ncbi:MAG: hypothetical protein HOG95_12315 [Rhodospirillaceae bacterium]|jgi:hypothetical protein|nr:hypothetical protein [Rhodospirillaceae bacterium]MBT4590280.1 hypothetical protein [Rhodospirillaceae bacterium]MBT5940704.1 hypothetical protein [Rhodospirillaceae bacterium]MBT7265932.1 hypothetical protein [Rhodospirillaceae bacterium]